MAFSRYRSQFIPVAALVFSIIGLIYSLIMSLGIGREALCLTSGCEIIQDFRMFGISPWWASAVMFAVLGTLCFLRMRLVARLFAAVFLAGDCVFLIIMFFVAPCSSCLIGGLLIFCCWLALRIDRAVLITARRIMAGALSATWLILFLLNLGYVANEAVPAWRLNGASPERAKISIFFSPSCPACREAVTLFSGRAVFYPVAENERDYLIIADIAARVDSGLSVKEALEAVLAEQASGAYIEPRISLWRSIANKVKIMRNQAALIRSGHRVLPVLIFEGLPADWAGLKKDPAPDAGRPEQPQERAGRALEAPGLGSPDLPPGLLPDFDNTLECGRASQKPCDDPTEAGGPSAEGQTGMDGVNASQ